MQIDDLEHILFNWMVDDVPDDLQLLGGKVQVEEVFDVKVEITNTSLGQSQITGSMMVSVSVQQGGDRDVAKDLGTVMTASFPGTFKVTLDKDKTVEEKEFRFDLNSWYE